MNKILLLVILGLGLPIASGADSFRNFDLYYGYSLMHQDMKKEVVQKKAMMHMSSESSKYVDAFVDWLSPNDLKSNFEILNDSSSLQAVVYLTNSNGEEVIIWIGDDFIYNPRSKKGRSVDASYKNKLHFFGDEEPIYIPAN